MDIHEEVYNMCRVHLNSVTAHSKSGIEALEKKIQQRFKITNDSAKLFISDFYDEVSSFYIFVEKYDEFLINAEKVLQDFYKKNESITPEILETYFKNLSLWLTSVEYRSYAYFKRFFAYMYVSEKLTGEAQFFDVKL